MGWIMYGIGAVAAACLFIPGVNIVAGISLAAVALIGAGMNVALQYNASKCDRLVDKIDSKIDEFEKYSGRINSIVKELETIEKELSQIGDELKRKFRKDGVKNFSAIDPYMMTRINDLTA